LASQKRPQSHHPANAQSVTKAQAYTVNGHTASKAEVQFLASYNAPDGHWVVDGFGMSQVSNEHPAARCTCTSA
jgi:hypothetical protein